MFVEDSASRANRIASRKARLFSPTVARPESSRDLFKRLAEEEKSAEAKAKLDAQREADRPIIAAQETFNKTLRDLNRVRRSNIDLPCEELAARCPQTQHSCTTSDEYSEKMLAAVRMGLAGITVTESEKKVLLTVAGANKASVDLTNPAVWTAIHRWCVEIGAIETEAAPKPQPVAQPQPVVKPTIDSLDVSTASRSGREAHLAVLSNDFLNQYAGAYSEFFNDCKEMFGSDFSLSDSEATYIADLLQRRNMAGTTSGFHKARALAAKSGNLNPKWQTNQELYDAAVAAAAESMPLMTTTDRIAYNRKVEVLRQQYLEPR